MKHAGIPRAYCTDRRDGQVKEIPFSRAAFFLRDGMNDKQNFLQLLSARVISLNTDMMQKMQTKLGQLRKSEL